MAGHHPISDLLATGKINQNRLSETADIVELTLELQKLKIENKDHEKIQLIQTKLAEKIFDADPDTLKGTIECLIRMIKNTIPDKV